MARQLTLDEFWREPPPPSHYQDSDMLHCELHGDWCPNAYYTEGEIDEMLREQGRVDCPYCLMEIVGFCN